MAKVFVSYSRKDITFAKRLTAELQKCELDFWIDWEGIPPTVDWWREIEKGIEEADVFVFLISPDSAKSKVCGQEIDTAVKNGKRVIPIVVRDIPWEDTPKHLGHLNYIFIREGDDFNAAVNKLTTAIQTDYEWAATHRRLQVKALDWERNNKENGYLLRGLDLLDAESDLATNTSKDPHPTDLQREYVFSSRKATDRQRRTTTSIAIGGVVVLAVLTAVAILMAVRATRQSQMSRAGELAAQAQLLIAGNLQDALLLGIESYRAWNTLQSRGALLNITMANPQLRQILTDRSSNTNVVFSPDGTTLVAGGCKEYDDLNICLRGAITLWNTATGEFLGQLIAPTGDPKYISSVAFSPDGKILASGSWDHTITLWDVERRQVTGQLSKHQESISNVAFSPDGRVLASGSWDDTIILWDVETHQIIHQLIQHKGSVTSVAFSPDGRVVASGSDDGTIILWNVETGQPVSDALFTEPVHSIYSIAFSPDGKILASGSGDGTIILWNVEEHQQIKILMEHSNSVNSITFSPDGKIMVSGSDDRFIILWDIQNFQPLSRLSGNTAIKSLAFSPDGKTLASGSSDKTIILLWSTVPHLPIGKLLSNTSFARSIVFSPGGQTLASGGCGKYDSDNFCAHGEIKLWDVATGRSIGPTLTVPSEPSSIAFSPDGSILASGICGKLDSYGLCTRGEIVLSSVATGQLIGEPLAGDTEDVLNVIFSPDGRSIVSLNSVQGGGKAIEWDTASGKPLRDLSTGGLVPSSVSFNFDGSMLALGDMGGNITLWDTATHETIDASLQHNLGMPVWSVAFSPDGKNLASGAEDGTIVLWDVATHQPLYRLTEYTEYVTSLAFSPDGQTLISGGVEIILWDVETGQSIGQPLGGIGMIAFSSDGKTLASVGEEGIILWDLNPESWITLSCQRAGRNFTRTEWKRYFPNDKYPVTAEKATCRDWPVEAELTPTPAP